MKHRRIIVNDLMQRGYVYLLTEPPGRNFHPLFRPDLTPKQMLELGVFGGKYMTDSPPSSRRAGSERPALRRTSRCQLELFRRKRLAAAFNLASEGMDLSRRPTRMVSVVLPLLSRPAAPTTNAKSSDGVPFDDISCN